MISNLQKKVEDILPYSMISRNLENQKITLNLKGLSLMLVKMEMIFLMYQEELWMFLDGISS